MADVNVHQDPISDLVVFRVTGMPEAAELIDVASAHFRQTPSRYVLWDLRQAEMNAITLEDMRELARRASDFADARRTPHTAIVVGDQSKRLLMRLYEAVAENEQANVIYRIFDEPGEAYDWFGAAGMRRNCA
ncbi:hypothetical protein [Minwuia sp.]|uniref:hypothetical protein n=1 Tax=Minwuia sp. TaxID=2493630 RepID=UPI003A92C1C9